MNGQISLRQLFLPTEKILGKGLKRLSLNSRLTFVGDTFYFVWMGVTKKRIEMQMYAVTQSFEEGKEKV